MTFDEFAAAAKQLEHITDCTIEACSYGVQITAEAYTWRTTMGAALSADAGLCF